MATSRKSGGAKAASGRTSAVKKKMAARAATRRMLIYFVSLILMFFAATRLGVFGVTLYNLVRLATGSFAYLLMALILLYMVLRLVRKAFIVGNRRLVWGVALSYLGLMLIIQAAFTATSSNDSALWHVLDDMARFEVTRYAAGGFIGWFFYIPFVTLFAHLGVTIVGAILLVTGPFVATPGLVGSLRQLVADRLAATDHRSKRQARRDLRAKRKAAAAEAVEVATEPVEPVTQDFEAEPASGGYPFITGPGADWDDVYQEDGEAAPEPVSDTADSFEDNFAATSAQDFLPDGDAPYQLPTSRLLTPIAPQDQSAELALVKRNSRLLEDTLRSFKISAQVVSSVVGPSVTKYELKLATGVKVARILNLSDDLALALAAKDVRIEAPIPGKSLVGVEIPNSEIATVGFRDMWEHATTAPGKLLEVPLGKSLDGAIRIFDLAKMPHLLVAGATGSGKSVAVNGIIVSILMKALPSQVKFLMVDPKMVELSVYNDIPHLLIPVVTNPRKAARALQKVVDEMEDRYLLFSRFGVRNIAGYNEKVAKENEGSETKYPPLPLIVVIVDELADLMMVASKEVEDAIIRLGQKARAAGIHMILATQRPSVDVISGLIKANVPSRVAFAVSSGTDSRTILDSNGAEKLLGRGDMLFKPIDENHPVRLQGAFISDEDVEAVVAFIKQQATAEYDDSFDPGEAEGDDSRSAVITTPDSGDPLFEEAKQLIITAQKASTAQLQRALKIGFNRATDLMNELEQAGIVGPAKGTTPRKVLMTAMGEYQSGLDD